MSSSLATPFRDHVPGDGSVAAGLRAAIWEQFTARILGALREAMTVLAEGKIGVDHEAAKGYWGTQSRKVLGTKIRLPRENAITDALTRALEVVRKDASPNDLLRQRQICFPPQQPRKRQVRLGSDALTTDIQARSLELDYLDLRIEAKVLCGANDVAQYCGGNGLLRFSDPEPYTDQHVGMMLGYSVRHDDEHWFSSIEARASPSPEVKAFTMAALGGEVVLTSTSSSHATGEVLVLHVLLPFDTMPSARSLDAAKKAAKPI